MALDIVDMSHNSVVGKRVIGRSVPQQCQTRPPRIRGYTGYHPTFSAPGHSETGGYSSALPLPWQWRPTRQSSLAKLQTASCSFLIDCKLWWHPASARPRHALCFQPVCALLVLLLPLFMFLFMPSLSLCLLVSLSQPHNGFFSCFLDWRGRVVLYGRI